MVTLIDAHTNMIITADDAFERHKHIIYLRNLVEQSFLDLGEELYLFDKYKQWETMGYSSFSAYLADPDVDISQGVASKLIIIHKTYRLGLDYSPANMLRAGYDKLYLIEPYVDDDNVDEWVEKAASTSRSDLRREIEDLKRSKYMIDVVVNIPDVDLREGDVNFLFPKIENGSIDLLIIDPPYNINKADWDSFGEGKKYAEWCLKWLVHCKRVLKPHGSMYIFGYNRMLSHIQHLLDEMGMIYRDWIIWDTIQGTGGGLWVNRYEAILFYSRTNNTYTDIDNVKIERHEENIREYAGKEWKFKNPSNIWRFPRVDDSEKSRTDHPTQKPVELIDRMIKGSCPPGGLILDPFIGSGTSAVAAIMNKCKCIGFDIDPEYIKLTKYRLSKLDV